MAAPTGSITESEQSASGPAPSHQLFRLNGWFEQQRISPWIAALFALCAAFVLFNGLGFAIGAILLSGQDIAMEQMAGADLIAFIMDEHPELLIYSNTIAQVLGLGLPSLGFVFLHSSDIARYVRLRAPDWNQLGLVLLGWVTLVPIVQWMEQVNRSLPLPKSVQAFDASQLELIDKVLASNLGLGTNLLALAIVPALCEELFFRGYVQRNLERASGAISGIAGTAVIFALYHLRLTQVLPLLVLGLYLGYVLWSTGSLWSAVGVHFLNNAFAVVVGSYVHSSPEYDMESLAQMGVPWYMVVLGILLTGWVMLQLRQSMARTINEQSHESLD